MTPPDLPEADEWADEDEWQKLAEELGALPPRHPESTPASSSASSASSSSTLERTQYPPAVPATEESPSDIPDWESEEYSAAETEAGPGQPGHEAGSEQAGEGALATPTEASTETEEDEETEGGRKRRRRRRRRRKGGSETASEPIPSLSTTATAEVPDAEEPEEIGGSAPNFPTTANALDWSDTTDPDQAAEILRDILAHWNVPSWDEIVAGLYRPER
jgi:hypothetical protein